MRHWAELEYECKTEVFAFHHRLGGRKGMYLRGRVRMNLMITSCRDAMLTCISRSFSSHACAKSKLTWLLYPITWTIFLNSFSSAISSEVSGDSRSGSPELAKTSRRIILRKTRYLLALVFTCSVVATCSSASPTASRCASFTLLKKAASRAA